MTSTAETTGCSAATDDLIQKVRLRVEGNGSAHWSAAGAGSDPVVGKGGPPAQGLYVRVLLPVHRPVPVLAVVHGAVHQDVDMIAWTATQCWDAERVADALVSRRA